MSFQLSCSFASYSDARYDTSARYPGGNEFFTLSSCEKDVKSHLHATAEGASDICSVRKGTYFGRGRIIRPGRGCCNRLSKAWRSARCLVEYKSETPPSVARK